MLGALKKNLKKLGDEAAKAAEKAADKASTMAEKASDAAEKAVKKAQQELAQRGISRSVGDSLNRLMAASGLNKDDNPHPNDFTNKILGFAQSLEWKVAVEAEDCVVAVFQIDEERSQGVYYFAHTLKNGEQVVEVHSPAVQLDQVNADELAALSNELLSANSTSVNSAWAIETMGEQEYIVAIKELLLDTMDCDEFSYATMSVCSSADELEQRFGGDQF